MIGLPLSPARLEFVALPGASHETSSSVIGAPLRVSAVDTARASQASGAAAGAVGSAASSPSASCFFFFFFFFSPNIAVGSAATPHGDGPTSFTAATRA